MAQLKDSIILGDLSVTGTIYGAHTGNTNGNASTATTLQTARTINGTSFNGSANITTANWGTARTITIGASEQSINGSANITYTPYAMRVSRALYATDTNPNAFAGHGCALGMINLGSNGAVDNPGGATGWHHIINLTYHNCADNDNNTTNNWCTQIMNPCGGANLWYRSRSGGSIANGTAWTTPWKHIWIEGNAVTSAVWNDYAEYRETDTQEFGRCVIENGDDTMSLSTKRLQKGCSITSDTWGFAQGQTEKAKTPIAVSGRVLAYPFENKEEFKKHIGDAVCSGPEGTVSIMTDEEVQKYPLSIIGTISAVPDYEEWGGGTDRGSVKVNGRVWIRVR